MTFFQINIDFDWFFSDIEGYLFDELELIRRHWHFN